MAYISTIPEEAASGEVAALYQADREAVGFVRNLTKAFSLAPEARPDSLRRDADPRRCAVPGR
jgi:hypothetical protein